MLIWHESYTRENAATLMKDGFLLVDSKLEVYQE